MLNRFRIDFDNIYSYATGSQPQRYNLEDAITQSDDDVAECNLETIIRYRYIYCESENKFATQIGRDFYTSAKNYGIVGLKAACLGIGISLTCDGYVTRSQSALSLVIGVTGGALLGGFGGGFRAIHTIATDKLLKTHEEKERVSELQRLAENRVSFFNHRKQHTTTTHNEQTKNDLHHFNPGMSKK